MPERQRSSSTRPRNPGVSTRKVEAQVLHVRDLSAGLNHRHSPTVLRPNQSQRLVNWSLEEPGALVTYPGFKSQTTNSLGTGRIQGAQRIYLSGLAPFTLAAFAGSVYKPADLPSAWPAAVLTGLSATNEIFFPHDRDLVAVLDSVTDPPKKSTNGTDWFQLGVSAPASAPSLATIAGGSLISGQEYEVSFAYQDDGPPLHFGNDGPTSSITPSGGNLTIRATGARSTDPQVDTVLIFVRNITAGESVRRKVGQVANPPSGSWTFDIDGPDTDWAEGIEAPTDHDVPPALSFAVVWKNRWWARDAVKKNRIRFTQLFQPQSWPGDFFVDLPLERGEDAVNLYPIGDTLIVSGYTKKFIIFGQTSLDFDVRPALGVQTGAFGARAADAIEDGLVTASAAGVFVFDGASERELAFALGRGWSDMVAKSTKTQLDRLPVVYHHATKECRVGVASLYPLGVPGEWVLDLTRTRLQENEPAWTATDRPVGGYIQMNGPEDLASSVGRLFSWHLSDGKLFEERTGTTADGEDLVGTYVGSAISTGLQRTLVPQGYIEVQPAAGTFSVELFVDGKNTGSQVVDIGGTLNRYNTFKYNQATYSGGGNRLAKPLGFPQTAEGYTFVVAAKYSGKERFRMFTYGLEIKPDPLPLGI